MDKPLFQLRLIWESLEHSPEWELETEHGHFANWVAPALFAEGYTSPHPRLLELREGRMLLRLNDGAILELNDEGRAVLHPRSSTGSRRPPDPATTPGLADVRVVARHLVDSSEDDDVAECEDYEEIREPTAAHLTRLGLDGEWQPTLYEVCGPNGPLSVDLEIDEAGRNLVARRAPESSSSEEPDAPDLMSLPKSRSGRDSG